MVEGIWSDRHEASSVSRIAGSIVFYFGAIVTVSWMMGLPLLWFEGWATKLTRPNSGLCFLLAGLALKLIREDRKDASWNIPEVNLSFTVKQTSRALGVILLLVGGLTVIEYAVGRNFHIGTLIVFQKWLREIDEGAVGMTLLTAVQFIFAGAAFMLIDRRLGKRIFPAELLAAAIMTVSLDLLIAFLYMSDTLPDIRKSGPVPIISSIMFLVLSIGILASRQDRGIVAVWVAKYNGSTLIRKWLPMGILIFISTGEIMDLLRDYGFMGSGTSLAVFTVVVITFITIVVLFSAVHLNDFEKELLHTNKLYAVLSQSNQTMVRTKDKRLLLNSICDTMVIYGDFTGAWVCTNTGRSEKPEITACAGDGCARLKEEPDTLAALLESVPALRLTDGDEYRVFNDIEISDLPLPVRRHMDGTGNKSMMVLRLTSFGETAGLMGVCSAEAGYFGAREENVLQEVSMDLSFALEGLERDLRRERAETALRESEERFRATFEKAAVGIVLLTPTGILMRANPRFCAITGYDESELAGRSFLEITHEEDMDKDKSSLDRLLSGEISTYSTEKRYIRKGGATVWVHLSAALVRGSYGEPQNLITVVQDISEQKEAEVLLRKSREQYQQFFEEDITGDFIATTEGQILSCNPAFARIFGFFSVEEAMKSNTSELYMSHEQRREFLALLQEVKKIEYHEMTLRRKDGSEIFVIRSSFGIFDEDGRLVRTKNYLFDDTRRKMLERQILQTQKMESLGTLAGGIAHDFNNILGIIMGHTGLLKRKDLDGNRGVRSIEAIELATKRGAGLIRQLLTFARKEDRALENLNINEIIKDLHRLLEETLPRLVNIRLELSDSPPLIIGDSDQIHQAMLNLCVNARDAMLDRKDGKPPGGTLSISTSHVDGEEVRRLFSNAVRRTYVRISVTDTGVGIDDAIRGHIFEPFFSTKDRGKGTGLGLATVYGIVEGHNGFINVSSEKGIGTSFTIFLPSQPPDVVPEMPQKTAGLDIAGGTETILVVEDEEMLMDFLKEVLTRKGYKVIAAPDGETAVSVFAANLTSVDLVLSDLGLPKLSGQDMLAQLLQLKPKLRVIFASGFMEPDTKSAMARAGVRNFIQKPYSAVEVLSRVREVLDS